jgi:hypothetical protein
MLRVHAERRGRLLLGGKVSLARLGLRFFLADTSGRGQDQDEERNEAVTMQLKAGTATVPAASSRRPADWRRS